MRKILDVRRVGYHGKCGDTSRSPEDFPFPACLCSLMEYTGKDAKLRTTEAHGREWTTRFLNQELLSVSGMAFGLLWSSDGCTSCMDLTQVNIGHDKTITDAFDYMGYACEIIKKTEDNKTLLFEKIVESINSNCPVLAFGIIGPPECCIICGYDTDKNTLIGWNYFQSDKKEDCAENGMFQTSEWFGELWKIVLCKEKKVAVNDIKAVVKRGLEIMEQVKNDGYTAGFAVYDEWIKYLENPAFKKMKKDELKAKHAYHHSLVGNHAEARCYLSAYLREFAGDDPLINEAANCFMEIHDTCWKVWGVLGGINKRKGYKGLKKKKKRAELGRLMSHIKGLDIKGYNALKMWRDKAA